MKTLNLNNYAGSFLPHSFIDAVGKDLNGFSLAAALENIGYTVTSHVDTGRNGLVILVEGFNVSTNGFVYKRS